MRTTGTGKFGYVLLAFGAVAIAATSMRFLLFDPLLLNEDLRPNLLEHPIPFYVHTTFAPLAMLVGVWQFLPVTRRSKYHRWAGRFYVACCLIGALSGFIIAFTTAAGGLAGAGFVALAILWFGSTLAGFLHGRARRFALHRVWMIRSYALTAAAISLRLIVPVGVASGLSFYAAYTAAAWTCWIGNLIIAELIIRTARSPAASIQAAG